MSRSNQEVVLVTGSSGFLGKHLLKLLQNDETVSEIRALDKVLDQEENFYEKLTKVKFFKRDLLDLEFCRKIFKDVDVVLHCAALVSYEFPPNKIELHKNNVLATKNIIKLCIEENISCLVHCSSTEVTLQSNFKGGIVALIIYHQESKLKEPEPERLIFGEYASSKLEAEKLILASNKLLLKNGKGLLYTVSLRPTWLYGDGDSKLIPHILKHGKKRGNLVRIAGNGGKQQQIYVGNAAWAFICAKNALRKNPEAISGLAVTITDDTLVEDLIRFCERVTRSSSNYHLNVSTWSIPIFISYIIAYFWEILQLRGFFSKSLVSLRGIIAYLGSVILYNRMRASIHLNYSPIFSAEESLKLSSEYYSKILEED